MFGKQHRLCGMVSRCGASRQPTLDSIFTQKAPIFDTHSLSLPLRWLFCTCDIFVFCNHVFLVVYFQFHNFFLVGCHFMNKKSRSESDVTFIRCKMIFLVDVSISLSCYHRKVGFIFLCSYHLSAITYTLYWLFW